ncbi:MAG: D-2-hydroxyacid dehydrogenase [Deltaproteobacteria bacterium]|jgi:glycerate dehydrogenase|nr:D-2-hydroxyacid dehydrogenase [Deltaproteobacteria bacterium]
MNKIVVLDGHVLNPGDLSWDGLTALGEAEIFERTPSAEVSARLKGRDLVLTNKTKLTRELLTEAPGIRYIGVMATGYDIVDIQAAKELGVVVTNVPTYGTAAVSQHAIALLLEVCHRVGHHSHAVYQGRWAQARDWCFWDYPMIELDGKTMGVIGLGRIGLAVAVTARAMGMSVVADEAHPNQAAPGWVEYLPLAEVLSRSHVINLSCPLRDSTAGIINKKTIERMRDKVIIVNTSRGKLIVEEDLAEALRSGKVLGAGLDVVSLEPIRPENPLLSAPNCFITPHVAGSPKESRERLLGVAVDNLKSFLAGKPVNVVNP